jgi:hypothetical protein
MEWWPGQPHAPHRNPEKVSAIQRSLDWRRVTQIAAYLLQTEIIDAPARCNTKNEVHGLETSNVAEWALASCYPMKS